MKVVGFWTCLLPQVFLTQLPPPD